MSTKEPCISTKEPYIPTKEPYIVHRRAPFRALLGTELYGMCVGEMEKMRKGK